MDVNAALYVSDTPKVHVTHSPTKQTLGEDLKKRVQIAVIFEFYT